MTILKTSATAIFTEPATGDDQDRRTVAIDTQELYDILQLEKSSGISLNEIVEGTYRATFTEHLWSIEFHQSVVEINDHGQRAIKELITFILSSNADQHDGTLHSALILLQNAGCQNVPHGIVQAVLEN